MPFSPSYGGVKQYSCRYIPESVLATIHLGLCMASVFLPVSCDAIFQFVTAYARHHAFLLCRQFLSSMMGSQPGRRGQNASSLCQCGESHGEVSSYFTTRCSWAYFISHHKGAMTCGFKFKIADCRNLKGHSTEAERRRRLYARAACRAAEVGFTRYFAGFLRSLSYPGLSARASFFHVFSTLTNFFVVEFANIQRLPVRWRFRFSSVGRRAPLAGQQPRRRTLPYFCQRDAYVPEIELSLYFRAIIHSYIPFDTVAITRSLR